MPQKVSRIAVAYFTVCMTHWGGLLDSCATENRWSEWCPLLHWGPVKARLANDRSALGEHALCTPPPPSFAQAPVTSHLSCARYHHKVLKRSPSPGVVTQSWEHSLSESLLADFGLISPVISHRQDQLYFFSLHPQLLVRITPRGVEPIAFCVCCKE